MVAPLVAAGLASAAGSVIGAGLDYFGQKKANKANISSAREQMDFQERMSNTQYQRTMEDMRLAGLNPILAAKLGGAGTPPGASVVSQSETGGASQHVGKASSSASEAMRMQADIANIKASTALSGVLARKAENEITNANLSTASQLRLQNAQGDNYDSQTALNALTGRNVLKGIDTSEWKAPLGRLALGVTSGVESLIKGSPGMFSRMTESARAARARHHANLKR